MPNLLEQAISADDGDRAAKIIQDVESDAASSQRDNKRSELKYRTPGRWWWRWRNCARRRDIQWRRRVRSLWQHRLPRSLDPASPDTILLNADRTNVAARARLSFLRMRKHAENRNDDRDDYRAYDRHSSPPLRHHTG